MNGPTPDAGAAQPVVNPFGNLIGWRVLERHNGQSRYTLHVDAHHMNPNGVLHGAVLFALADNGMGSALTTLLGPDELCASITVNIAFLRPVFSGELVCATRVVQRGGRVAFLESEIKQGDTLVAKASGTFSIFKTKA